MAKGYSYNSHGTNSQGNHYCSRDYGSSAPNQNSYHYRQVESPVSPWLYLANMQLFCSNSDGSYYYSNPNGSTYYNSGSGQADYTSPSGGGWTSSGGSRQSK
ncbi:unnamed protein product [Rhizoctonia solani]|uniref:Uncharacterized protein n=1 Tax=Rhizoctonia solani TaxID=456999 RepID=A0A8H3ARW6_9AGAM|nr:unnamed protein product [Rhizoctonia solani]